MTVRALARRLQCVAQRFKQTAPLIASAHSGTAMTVADFFRPWAHFERDLSKLTALTRSGGTIAQIGPQQYVTVEEGMAVVLPVVESALELCGAGWPRGWLTPSPVSPWPALEGERPKGITSHVTLMNCYTVVYGMMAAKHNVPDRPGDVLYAAIGAACTRFLGGVVMPQLVSLHGAALLHATAKQWRCYCELLKCFDAIFTYLDTYYTVRGGLRPVTRRRARGHFVDTLSMPEVTFRDTVLRPIEAQLEALRTAACRSDDAADLRNWETLDALFGVFGWPLVAE